MPLISSIVKYNKHTMNNRVYFEFVISSIPVCSCREDRVRFLMAKMSHKLRKGK